MTCIGTAYGASPLTFLGLAGVGDLFLTCSSSNSRNYTVGYRLGKGEALDDIMKTIGSTAEGVPTTKAVKSVVNELGVNAPIASAVSGDLLQTKAVDAHDFERCTTSCTMARRPSWLSKSSWHSPQPRSWTSHPLLAALPAAC
jgi:Glycerol-3-phosphate dehydrogenase